MLYTVVNCIRLRAVLLLTIELMESKYNVVVRKIFTIGPVTSLVYYRVFSFLGHDTTVIVEPMFNTVVIDVEDQLTHHAIPWIVTVWEKTIVARIIERRDKEPC